MSLFRSGFYGRARLGLECECIFRGHAGDPSIRRHIINVLLLSVIHSLYDTVEIRGSTVDSRRHARRSLYFLRLTYCFLLRHGAGL